MNNKQKYKFVYIQHIDNLEGTQRDYLMTKITTLEHIEHINDNSDGECSYTVLYMLALDNEILTNYSKRQ